MADIKTLAEKMMRDSWATGDDAAWHPARDALHAALDALAEAHQAEVARLTRENEGLAKALGEIAWSNDSKWQSDRADAALAGASGAQEGERT